MKATTSQKQIAANQRNGKMSHGPKTPEGRQRVAGNFKSLKHGLTSSAVVVPGLETPEAWEEHRDAILDSLAPQNALEAALAERAALAIWRLTRCARAERAELQRVQDPIEAREANAMKLIAPAEIRYQIEGARGAVRAIGNALSGRNPRCARFAAESRFRRY